MAFNESGRPDHWYTLFTRSRGSFGLLDRLTTKDRQLVYFSKRWTIATAESYFFVVNSSEGDELVSQMSRINTRYNHRSAAMPSEITTIIIICSC